MKIRFQELYYLGTAAIPVAAALKNSRISRVSAAVSVANAHVVHRHLPLGVTEFIGRSQIVTTPALLRPDFNATPRFFHSTRMPLVQQASSDMRASAAEKPCEDHDKQGQAPPRFFSVDFYCRHNAPRLKAYSHKKHYGIRIRIDRRMVEFVRALHHNSWTKPIV